METNSNSGSSTPLLFGGGGHLDVILNGGYHHPLSQKLTAKGGGGSQAAGPVAVNAINKKGIEIYNVVSHLGSGNYGDVYLVEHTQTKKKYAMKLLDKEKLASKKHTSTPSSLNGRLIINFSLLLSAKNMLKYAIAERNVMSKCNSPFIVKMYHSFQTESHLVIVMDYCPGGDLYSYLLQKKR